MTKGLALYACALVLAGAAVTLAPAMTQAQNAPGAAASLPPLPTYTFPPQAAAPAATPSGPSFDDESVHFAAPAAFEKAEVPPGDSGDNHVVAAFIRGRGQADARTITIAIRPWTGSLPGLEASHESELRGASNDTFVRHKAEVYLANNMPAYFLSVQSGDGFNARQSYEYVVFDGERGIVTTYAGRVSEVHEREAQDALASLAIVVHPHGAG